MFSDDQKREWQSVRAPEKIFSTVMDELENKNCECGKNSHKGFKRIAFPLIAASLLFVFASIVFLGKTEDVSILYGNTVLSSEETSFEVSFNTRARLLSYSIVLDIDIKKDTLLKTDYGYFEILDKEGNSLSQHTELLLDEDVKIRWNYPVLDTETVATLELVSGTSEYEIKLTHDLTNNTRTLICTRK